MKKLGMEVPRVGGAIKACRLVRRLAAGILLVALFLPLSRCSEQPSENAPSAPATYRYYYAWTDFKASEILSWLAFLTFLWPLPFLAREAFARRAISRIWLSAIQLPLSAGAIILISYQTFLNQLWIGGYLAYIALGAYSLALAAELIVGIIVKRRSRPRVSSGPAGPIDRASDQ